MGQNLKRTVLGVALAAALLVGLPFPVDSEQSADGETFVLRLGLMQQIDSLNPFVGLNDASRFFYGLVYDALACVGNDLEVVPNLAVSEWAVPIDYDSDPKLVGMPYGSVWQYNLSTDAYWADGEQFTADDVVYNIWLSVPYPATYESWACSPFFYFTHEAWKIDNYTVRISFWDRETLEPTPAAFADLLSIPMLPKHLLEKLPGGYAYIKMNWTGVFPDWISPGMPIVGTGPFMVTPDIYSEWAAGDHITLVRNPSCHWASDYNRQVKFDQIVLRFFINTTSMVLALKESEIDAAAFPPTAFDSIKDDIASGTLKNITIFDGRKVSQSFTYVGFCMADSGPNPSRLDPVVRQALHMATNKSHISETMYLGYAETGTTLIPPVNTQWHYEPTASEKFEYNLTAAADLLEANGYIDVDTDGWRECTIISQAVQMGWVDEGTKLVYQMLVRKEYPEEKDIAQYLKSQWAQVGVNLNYTVLEELTLSQIAYSYNYDTLLWYSSADLDPNFMLFTQSRSAWSGLSDNKYYSPAFDENYSNSVKSMDKVQRKVYVYMCQIVHYNDSAYIVLAYPHSTYALRIDTVTGWGDWAAHPGRSLDNYWTGNPLFFDLEVKEPANDTSPKKGDLLADYWWIAPIAAIAVTVTAVLIYLSRKRIG